MSDEQTPTNQTSENIDVPGDEWVMPEPVFRTSGGHTPKSSKDVSASEDDTAGATVDEFAETLPGGTFQTFEPISTENQVRPLPPKQKGGCAQSVMLIVGIIGFVVVAVIAAAIYFLFYYHPADTVTF